MFRWPSDRHDDTVNPLKPWRSAAAVFLAGVAVVLADVLDLPAPGRYRRHDGFEPWVLAFPFVAVTVYLVFWMLWRSGARRWALRSRTLRDRLRAGSSPPEH